MKSLLKLAVGAAIAGALVSVLMKQRSTKNPAAASYGDGHDLTTPEFTPTELVADTSSVGEGSGDPRVQLPDDGRVAPGKLNS
jgi:hypothetical protein